MLPSVHIRKKLLVPNNMAKLAKYNWRKSVTPLLVDLSNITCSITTLLTEVGNKLIWTNRE